jgi:hypothetical protein
MTVNFSYEIVGAPGVRLAYDQFAALAAGFTRLIEPTVEDWFRSVEFEQFLTEGAAGEHGRWAALKPRTEEAKLREHPFAVNILQRTGALMLSLARPGTPYGIKEVTDDLIGFGTTRPGAVYHQRGTGRMPARRPIDPSALQKAQLLRRIKGAVVTPLRRAGLAGYLAEERAEARV